MASRTKEKFGGKIKYCIINLVEFITSVSIFFTTLGSYDIFIRMDWLETHNVILNCKTKRLSLIDNLGQNRVIVGRNRVSLRFITSLQLNKNMCKGCIIYAILALNKKGDTKTLEDFPIVSEFVDVFPEELPSVPPKRELEFTIDLKPGT
jgi:hypothetical protein